jgi:lipid II:glycine glycyltransferase (peptidoglycan interpeptide bridge formation enzyme)
VSELRAWRVDDARAWNRLVETADYRAFPQLWEWGELRRPFGWEPVRIAVGESREAPLAGAQLLLRTVPLIGWRLGYAPRGPVGALDGAPVREALLRALATLARRERIATIKVDPAATPDASLGRALLAPPWRTADKVQPPRTRIVDLRRSEEELRGGLKRKHRQYVNKAERAGIAVEWFDAESGPAEVQRALDDFYAIYTHTALRAGFVARADRYYRRVWELSAPGGRARLLFASRDGERLATLFCFVCGDRVAEAFGGMTDAGAESRANYLLKWEAIRGFRAEGRASYDLWGLATGGIAQFKEGFGGEQVDYVGARDWPIRPPVDALLRIALPAYGIAQRTRLRLQGRHLSGSED